MSLAAHLAELSAKHQTLERRLAEEFKHPSVSDEELKRLKLEKLRLKELIQRLQGGETRH